MRLARRGRKGYEDWKMKIGRTVGRRTISNLKFPLSNFQLLVLRATVFALTLVYSSCQKPPAPPPAAARQLAIPAHGIYAGAYIEAGDKEDDVTLEKIDDFERLVGKHQAIIASSS